jgi:hypothetical protein
MTVVKKTDLLRPSLRTAGPTEQADQHQRENNEHCPFHKNTSNFLPENRRLAAGDSG